MYSGVCPQVNQHGSGSYRVIIDLDRSANDILKIDLDRSANDILKQGIFGLAQFTNDIHKYRLKPSLDSTSRLMTHKRIAYISYTFVGQTYS